MTNCLHGGFNLIQLYAFNENLQNYCYRIPFFGRAYHHPYDFFDENMRRLSIQGIFWALGMENSIPDQRLDIDFTMEYDPNPAGFGRQFKQGFRPQPTIRHIFGLYVEIIPSVIGTYQKFGLPLLEEYDYSLELEDGLLKEASMSQVETLELSNF